MILLWFDTVDINKLNLDHSETLGLDSVQTFWYDDFDLKRLILIQVKV